MGAFAAGSVVLAEADRDDLILCQVTSQARFDGYSIPLAAQDLQGGSLHMDSFVRPNRLFTVHQSVILRSVGRVTMEKLDQVLAATAALFRTSTKS